MARILVIDDNDQIRRAVEKFLVEAGHDPVTRANGGEGLEALVEGDFDLVITDLKMPVMTGLEFLEKSLEQGLKAPVILLTGHGTIDSAVEAMKMGASDYLSKPLQFPELAVRIERLLERNELKAENERLKTELRYRNDFENIIGESEAMQRVFDTLRPLAADGNISVVIYGETGTGKELVAKALHYDGPRAEKPFVAINCGAIPEQLLENELFGHEKGAFTDARREKKGLFETADGGTLFLDEIDSMPVDVQVKLLRAIEERVIRKVGGTVDIPLDIRLICATSSDLESMVAAGGFRKDLYFRIAVAPVSVPPLRNRSGDVLLLARFFAGKKSSGKSKELEFSKKVEEALLDYNWPGNVRELENLVELLSVTNRSGTVDVESLPPVYKRSMSGLPDKFDAEENQDLKLATKQLVEAFERRFILEKLETNRWNISRTALEIGLSRAALHSKIKQLNLKS